MSDTVKEARIKICPFRFDSEGSYDCCWGTSCMAWRWDDDGFERQYNYPTTKVSWLKKGKDGTSTIVEKYVFVLPEGWEFRNPVDAEREEDWAITTILQRPWGENRKGFCGLCEPKVAEVEINS